VLVSGGAPHEGLQHPATVERQPRDEVEHADDEVGAGQALDRQPDEPVGHEEPESDRGTTDGDGRQGPDDRDPELVARPARGPVDLRHAAQEVQGDGGDAVAEALGGDSVGGLVQQHREVEDDREDEPGDVLPEPQPGLDLLDARRERQRDQQGDEEPRAGDQDVDARDGADPQRARGSG
jgi:hypothetical protein